MKLSRLLLLMSILGLGFMTGCASPSGRELLEERQEQNHSRAAGYATDGFTLDNRMPESRPQRAWQFYYKQCALVSRNPYPNHDEYACGDPF